MPHYHLESLQNDWKLVRETRESQIFRGTTPRGLNFTADIHFTPGRNVTVALVFVGRKEEFTKGAVSTIFEDLSHLSLRRRMYKMIDYTLVYSSAPNEGNYEIDAELIRSYKPEPGIQE